VIVFFVEHMITRRPFLCLYPTASDKPQTINPKLKDGLKDGLKDKLVDGLEDELFAEEGNCAYQAGSEQIAVARAAVAVVERRFGTPVYARVDLVRDDSGAYQVLELELVEPSLFLPQAEPEAAERMVAAFTSAARSVPASAARSVPASAARSVSACAVPPHRTVVRPDGLRVSLPHPAGLAALTALPDPRWLAVRSETQIDLERLAELLHPDRMPHLLDLSIDAPVPDIQPLTAMAQLRSLQLENTEVASLAPLAHLHNLQDLAICGSSVWDLSPIAGLRLKRLFLTSARVSDLSALAGMESLSILSLAGCPIRDLKVVADLPGLHYIDVRKTPVQDLGDLRKRFPTVVFDWDGKHSQQ
jgi:hypothetical protein